MGPENKNLFNNRLGMRPSRNLSAMDELNRISAQTQAQNQPQTPQSVSTSSDIVLSGGSAPKNQGKKRFLIIISIITVFAVLTGIGVYFALQQNKNGRIFTSEYTKTYNDYVEYLLNGENAEKTATLTTVKENNELVYPFNFNTVKKITYKEKTNINSYFENLNTKLNTLKEKAGSNKKDSVEKNITAVEILEKTINYPKYFSELKAEYKKSESAAKTYIQNNFSYSGDNDSLKNISALQSVFYESLISEYIVYSGIDCINSDGYDYSCAIQKYGLNGSAIISEFEQQVSTAYKKLTDDSALRILNKAVIDLTTEMSEN